jgi:serine/threonine-protein kinase
LRRRLRNREDFDLLPSEGPAVYTSGVRQGVRKGHATDWAGQTLFGKWTVERLIGVGGTSTVLQARHRNGRRAALKVLHRHLAAHGHARERFLREGRLANLVDHPGVVAVLDDFVTEDGTAVLVLELVQGKNLATRAKELGGVLEPREVVDAAGAVLEILAVAHDAGVIHRDIKPENILVRASGGYKLTDFGLAGLSHELGMLTGVNASLGTPAYMSPEQARGDTLAVDARTDLWGLGATMFTLLTGRLLHSASATKNLVVAAATEPAPPLRSIEPSIQPDLAELVDRALRANPEERWPNARAMLAALAVIDPRAAEPRAPRPASLDDGPTATTSPSSIMSWARPRALLARAGQPSRRRLAWSLVAATSVTSVALFAWMQVGETRDGEIPSAAAAPPPPPVRASEPAPPAAAPAPSAAAKTEVPTPTQAVAKATRTTRPEKRQAEPKSPPKVETATAAAGDDEVMDRRK